MYATMRMKKREEVDPVIPSIRNIVLLVAFLYFQPLGSAQVIRIDRLPSNDQQGGFFARWDPIQEQLIMYRNVAGRGAIAAKVVAKDGGVTQIVPLWDILGSQFMNVLDVAAMPDGATLISGVVGYTPRGVRPAQLKSALLVFDRSGKLASFWEVQPYEHDLVAVDPAGEVFGFGLSNLVEPYPLIVKYSPDGKVLKEFFSSSLLTNGEKDLFTIPTGEDNQLFISADELVLWLAYSKEVFRFSLDGALIARVKISAALNGLLTSLGSTSVRVIHVSSTPEGDLLAQVSFLPKPVGGSQLTLVRVAADGSHASIVSALEDTSRLIGRSASGKLIYLELDHSRKTVSLLER
jgi:hypothetical protein